MLQVAVIHSSLLCNIPSWLYPKLLTRPGIDGCFGSFQILSMARSLAVNVLAHVHIGLSVYLELLSSKLLSLADTAEQKPKRSYGLYFH